jgi:type I restriction enzyme S subunit
MKEGWVLENIGDICQIVNGGTPKTNVSSYWDGDINWITPADLGKLTTKLVGSTKRKITQIGLEKSSAKLFPPNSIILSTRAPIGHLAINTAPMCTNQGCRGLVPKNRLDVWYLFYFLWNNVDLLDSLGSGTTFKELSTKALSNVLIPTPPLPEQQRIVSIIDKAFEAIDKAIENTQKNLQNAKDLFESYLNSVFENGGEGWERKKLGDIASVQYGYTDKSFDEGQFRYIRITDISPDGTLIAEDKKYLSDLNKLDLQDYILEHHDLLMARTGATFAKVLLYENLEPSVFASYLIKIKFKVHIENELYWYFTKTKMYWLQAHHLSSGSAQPQFNGAALKQLEVSYPTDIVKQKELIKEFKELLLKVTELESQYQQKLRDLEELKKSILNKAFAGEL